MKKFILLLLVLLPLVLVAQIGVRAGINFASVTNISSVSGNSRTGWHAGIIMGSQPQKLLGFRSELTYSKQGYNYQSGINTGDVHLDYVVSSNLMTINITRFVQIQAGFQVAYLLSAKDNGNPNGGGGMQDPNNLGTDQYNRFDYGFGGGLELSPVEGLILGGRLNISLGKIYKDFQAGQAPSFSADNIRNNVFQVYAGWRFGKKQKT